MQINGAQQIVWQSSIHHLPSPFFKKGSAMSWPTNRPKKFGKTERRLFNEAIDSNELWYWKADSNDGFVNKATKELQKYFDSMGVTATSSGTASIHVALGASEIKPGSEVILSPITDAGSVTPIIYQNCIPVFADVDSATSILTKDHIEEKITEHTAAIILVHLAGCPTNIEPIINLCRKRNIVLIEDAAQSLGALHADGRRVGTKGNFGCFSLNDQKHITCGEGGFVICHSDEDYYLCQNYADKFYDRHKRGVRLERAALNYRMSEVDGAITLAQLSRLEEIAGKRSLIGDYLSACLLEIDGFTPQPKEPEGRHAYFYYQFSLSEEKIGCTRDQFIFSLQSLGIPASKAYVSEALYRSPMFKKKSFFPGSVWPAEAICGRHYDYQSVYLQNAEHAIASTVSLRLHEGLSEDNVDWLVKNIKDVIISFKNR
jgi:perosamine synthetase